MAQPGDRIREPSGVELAFVDTPRANGAGKLVCEWTIPPGRRLVARAHRHPDGPEGWSVVEGEARHKIAGIEHEAHTGDGWEVPGNTSHVHPWNIGSGPLTVRQTIDAPGFDDLALGVERYFETLMALAQRGETDDKFDIRSRLQSALTIRELLMPGSYLAGLPTWFQDAVFAPAAALARRRGLRAYIQPEYERGA
jgi:mannose-6-phosphate isomerase-like protein (cupin superfamily)